MGRRDADGNGPSVDPNNPPNGGANAPNTDAEAGDAGQPPRFTPDQNNPDIDPSTQVHIIEGNVKPNGGGTGAHYPNSSNIIIDEGSVALDPGGSGVFQAKVEICCDAQGNYVPKSNSPFGVNKDVSTFFPREWNSQKVLEEIASAAKQINGKNGSGTFRSPSGIMIFVRKQNGKIAQAYPAWPQ